RGAATGSIAASTSAAARPLLSDRRSCVRPNKNSTDFKCDLIATNRNHIAYVLAGYEVRNILQKILIVRSNSVGRVIFAHVASSPSVFAWRKNEFASTGGTNRAMRL